MGAYIYRTSPNALATIEVQWRDGHCSIEQVSLYSYLGKPSWVSDHPANSHCSRMTRLAEGQFRKAGPHRQPSALGVLTYEKAFNFGVAGSPVAEVGHAVTVYDDFLKHVGKVVRVISLPRGYKATSPSDDLRERLLRGGVEKAAIGRGGEPMRRYYLYLDTAKHSGTPVFSMDKREYREDGHTGELLGHHELAVSETDANRLWAHWQGFSRGQLPA